MTGLMLMNVALLIPLHTFCPGPLYRFMFSDKGRHSLLLSSSQFSEYLFLMILKQRVWEI